MMPLLQVIEFSAVVTSAIYGALIAHRKGMDFVGLFALGFIAAFGGGTLRDLFLDRSPLFWIANGHYPIVVFFLTLMGSILPQLLTKIEKYLPIPDSSGSRLRSGNGNQLVCSFDHRGAYRDIWRSDSRCHFE
jgi:uncharacterized membrane protein YeiH